RPPCGAGSPACARSWKPSTTACSTAFGSTPIAPTTATASWPASRPRSPSTTSASGSTAASAVLGSPSPTSLTGPDPRPQLPPSVLACGPHRVAAELVAQRGDDFGAKRVFLAGAEARHQRERDG